MYNKNLKELNEAKLAAKEAYEALERAESKFNSASNWGIYDIIGGGFLSSVFKYNKIDDAEYEMENVKSKLRTLKKELKDIEIDFSGYIETTTTDRVLDIAFDNIFSDLNTQSKIKQNLRELSNIKSVVLDIIRKLDNISLNK